MMSDPSSEFPSAAAAAAATRCRLILCSDRMGVMFAGLFLDRSMGGAC